VNTSSEMNNASNKLNALSNKQASSVEELVASMEELRSSIEQNASNSKKTTLTAKKVSEKAIGGGEKVAETAQNMLEISSRIKIVEDIAFKINLLALNASVEAAHAGTHGKGFAVVAGEVKKLSEQTKQSAQDIDQMVQGSTDASNQAGVIVSEIVPEIGETAQLIEEISNATKEQNSNIAELNNSMEILNQIATESASLAQNLVDTFMHLDERTQNLKTTMDFFKID
jgi:methyl-accepting chemotaxis protein